MIDIALDTSTRDVYLTDYDLTLIAGVDVIAQRLGIALRLFRGEWFIKENDGVPYYQEALVSAPKRTLVEAVLRLAILSTPGVESLKSFQTTYYPAERRMTVVFTVLSEEGEIEISEVFP